MRFIRKIDIAVIVICILASVFTIVYHFATRESRREYTEEYQIEYENVIVTHPSEVIENDRNELLMFPIAIPIVAVICLVAMMFPHRNRNLQRNGYSITEENINQYSACINTSGDIAVLILTAYIIFSYFAMLYTKLDHIHKIISVIIVVSLVAVFLVFDWKCRKISKATEAAAFESRKNRS